ncbi:sugar transporter [Bifidobacterium saguini DSM 23967]|uniref:Sugar transporter n=2 Tax=Bifidobacterium saguini TaxID=762210 RepID=A0A087DFC3_9BIFI|nr:MFS transporter [Bifidobacterium saguini]KFI94223.1 sugar transporter [Bifidobacterium saguini DSM 23967]QTB90512.1 MFS transporter [Bifidobacterium saguini]
MSVTKDAGQQAKLGKYAPLVVAAGIGSMLGSGIIVGLASTITVWQSGLGMTAGQVGIVSGALTFAIAFGSIFGGRFADAVGRVKVFNWINLLYAIGALICVFAPNYVVLLVGVVIAGVASGTDLPVSLAVVSHDAPDSATQAKLVSSTQVFWQAGIFISYICAFVVSAMSGAMGARIVFVILTVFAAIAWIWRTTSKTFQNFHDEADKRLAEIGESSGDSEKFSVFSLLFGKGNGKYLAFFIAIFVFYAAWNLLANTWGQFQTYMLVQANASQSLATGLGIVLNVIAFLTSMFFASVASGKHRNTGFVIGGVIEIVAVAIMAIGGGGLWIIVAGIALYNIGSPMAGEAMYKVWTQESYPVKARATVQGIINGASRVLCALFALITPTLVLPENIKGTMWGFVGIASVSLIFGLIMIALQKKHGTDADRLAGIND